MLDVGILLETLNAANALANEAVHHAANAVLVRDQALENALRALRAVFESEGEQGLRGLVLDDEATDNAFSVLLPYLLEQYGAEFGTWSPAASARPSPAPAESSRQAAERGTKRSKGKGKGKGRE